MGVAEVFEAARSGDVEGVEAALSANPELVRATEAHGVTLLHEAAERDDLPMTEVLLRAGCDPSMEAAWGQTPFEWAANMNSSRVAEHLLELGTDRFGLWTAAALGRLDRVQAAFEADGVRVGEGRAPRPGSVLDGWPSDVPFRTGDVVSDAFYIACRNGRLTVARFLLERGADVDATGFFGATALHWASMNGHRPVVEWLIEVGADRERTDPKFDGRASGWAQEGGHDELATWLRERGA